VPKGLKLSELAERVGGRLRGDGSVRVRGVAAVAEAGPDQITWVTDRRYAQQLAESHAGAVFAPLDQGPTPMPAVLVDHPGLAMIKAIEAFAPPVPAPAVGVDPSARLHDTARLGKDVAVGPNVVIGPACRIGDRTILHAGVFIGDETQIGDDCVLWPSVVVRERCHLGNRVIVHPNVTIGSDGFGYEFADGRHHKIPQIGEVLIEDDVEIGAGSCIDRGKLGQTVVGVGTKIDNLVQVAHNVRIGPHCILVSQVGIAGSAQLGAYVVLGGKAGVRDHITVGDRVQGAAGCGIFKDVPAGMVVNGLPAVDSRQYLRQQALVKRLPNMAEQLRQLSARVARLEQAADD